jgi:SAM-dependent methyltransferase
MKLSRKIQKLVTTEALESLWDHAKRWTHPVDAKKILGGINRKAWDDLRARYPQGSGAPRINRFSDVDHWLKINTERAQDLWLDRSPPLRILDLGCGPGYFLYVCQQLGHEGLGIDIDEQPLFRETTALLGVRRVIHRIEAQTPLPDLGEKFDLVSGHRVCFQKTVRWGTGPGEWHEWDSDDWKFFLDDVRRNVLNPDGRILLDFNPRADGRSFFTPELRAVLLENGARIFRSKALLAASRNQKPQFKLATEMPAP